MNKKNNQGFNKKKFAKQFFYVHHIISFIKIVMIY